MSEIRPNPASSVDETPTNVKMESSYGIGVTNRYDLFCLDDDSASGQGGDSAAKRKAKQAKRAEAKAAAAAAAAATTVSVATAVEKENKGGANAAKKGGATGGKPSSGMASTGRPIKETQNLRNNAGGGAGAREGQCVMIFQVCVNLFALK